MSSVKGFTDYNFLNGIDLVIEAVPERMYLKKAVFQQLDKRCASKTILASNTSSLSISELGAETQRPDKVIGMHWFNPSHIMKLIEIVPGLETSEETIEALNQLCQRLQKIPVRVKECAGFLMNRILGNYVNEAIFMVQEGHDPEEIDAGAESLEIRMGPITLGEMVGWDTIYHSNATLHEEFGSRFAVPALLIEMVKSERLGSKSGKGFYRYENGRVIRDSNSTSQILEQISMRLLSAMINEGIRCLDEKVATLEDIDTSMKVGAGMPKGPLQWADEIGLEMLLQQILILRESYGERFLPSPLLRRKVAAGHLGKKTGKGFYQY
jgi:3-hydroxyacyl-CoA dehydrogenase